MGFDSRYVFDFLLKKKIDYRQHQRKDILSSYFVRIISSTHKILKRYEKI